MKQITIKLCIFITLASQSLPSFSAYADVDASLPSASYNRIAMALAATAIMATARTAWSRYTQYAQHQRWAWNTIATSNQYPPQAAHFPPGFIWGVGTSAYQVEGNCNNSSYEQWYKTSAQKPGIACDHEHRYKEDSARMKHELNANAYRFSLEWSKIEPQENVFDKAAINRYIDMCRELLKNGIRPVIGFHHYSDPQWFLDKGGFAKEGNIDLFVRFCTTFFNELTQQLPELFETDKQPYFLTFNSPASYAANGYLTGTRPPGAKNMQSMAEVLKNMLEAHVRVYQSLKHSALGNKCSIGITHNIYQLDPANWCNPIQQLKCYVGNMLVHNSVYQFFTTGNFKIYVPFKAYVKHHNKHATHSLDFIGLNYYSHAYMGTLSGPQPSSQEIATDNPMYTIYAEGLYRAIKELSDNLANQLNIPIIITENGIGTNDHTKRDLFLKRYMYALSRALNDGYNVRGYIHWSFMDNFEWGTYAINYGIYAVDRSSNNNEAPSLQRRLKKGAHYLVQLMRNHAGSITS